MSLTKTRALIWLTLIWLAVRIYPAVMGWSSLPACGEVVAARKMLEVGVRRLHGGQLFPTALYGTVAHPEHYVFVHGASPTIWLYTALYYCFGFAGVSAVIYLLKYAALVLCFLVLDRCFSRSSAFWAAALYAVAPLSIVCEGASNTIILSAIFWPISLALIVFRLQRKETSSPGDLLLAGATAFLAGQSCYFGFTLVPSLAVINSRVTSLRPRALRAVVTDPVSVAFLAGGALSFLVFLGLLVLYQGSLSPLTNYALHKAGASAAGLRRLYVTGLVPVRISFFVGLALTFVSLLGCLYLAKDRTLANKQPVMGIVSYFDVFGGMVLAAPSAFVEENMYYSYLIFPGTVMAALLFDTAGYKLRKLILILGVVGIVLALLYASVPIAGSPTSRYLGKIFAEHSKKTDFIFTNIKPAGPPYKASDIGGYQSTKVFADRFITFGVTEPAQLSVAGDLIGEETRFQYWKLRSLPVGAALETELVSKGKLLKTLPLTFPEVTETLTEKLRAFVWYSVMKKGGRRELGKRVSSDVIDVYEIKVPAQDPL
jgi:hypothetical protein